MHLIVPYDDSELARFALREAYRIAAPLDRVTAMAPVIVPSYLPIDVSLENIQRPVHRADLWLQAARDHADRVARCGGALHCARVQAHDRVTAIVAGAAHYEADLIIVARRGVPWWLPSAFFGDLNLLVRNAPCDVLVRFSTTAMQEATYLDHPQDGNTVVRMSVPFQQPRMVAVCNPSDSPDTRSGGVIHLFDRARREEEHHRT